MSAALISLLLTGGKQSTSKCCLASSAQMPSYVPTCQLGISARASASAPLLPLTSSSSSCISLLLSSSQWPSAYLIRPTVNLQNSSTSHGWFSSGLRHPSRRWCQHSSMTGFLSEGFGVSSHSNRATFLLLSRHWLEAWPWCVYRPSTAQEVQYSIYLRFLK